MIENYFFYYFAQKTDNFIYLVMEYCEGGDLSQYLRKKLILKESEAQSLLQQLTSALKVLWDNNLIHRDLKPQNLLLQHDTDGKVILKIADFGFARYVEPTDLAETLCGSPLYMAPEILRYEKYDSKADLWSVGAIAYEMVFGSPPYKADNHIHLLRLIESSDDSKLNFPSIVTIKQKSQKSNSFLKEKFVSVNFNIETSDIFRDLLLKLLKKDPNKRISFEEFFTHQFVKETVQISSGKSIKHSTSASTIGYQGSSVPTSSGYNESFTMNSIEEILRFDDENSFLFEPFENSERSPPVKEIINFFF